ncbi:MAG: S41 family peptidase [Gemmatimonas sp.]
MIAAARRGQARAVLCGLLALLAADCAGPRRGEQAFEPNAGGRVFAVAFHGIHDKYVDAIPMGILASSALEQVSSLDHDFVAEVGSGEVRLIERGRVIGRAIAPDDDDPDGWARITTEFITAAEDRSRAVASATAEEVYARILRGALHPLDSLSRYADARQARAQRAARDGYGGIGAQITVDARGVVISSVSRDGPAARASIRAGDIILRIDGEDVRKLDEFAAIDRLRGRPGTPVRLSLSPTGAAGPQEVVLTRTSIIPETVRLDMIGDAALIKVTSFNQGTARSLSQMVAEARRRTNGRFAGIILDLRGNPGGLLDQAVAVADIFLSSGRIISTRGRHPDSFQLFDATGSDAAAGAPIVVLIDGGSASSSEVVAAALQDRGRAVVVGSNSYGKGTVQNIIRLPNDGELAITWSRLYAPSGYTFDGLGILPNVCTSAVEEDGSAVLARISRGEITDALRLAAWRTATDLDEAQRRDLARTCPKARGERTADLDVARGLLAQRQLYAKALALAVPAEATASRAIGTSAVPY